MKPVYLLIPVLWPLLLALVNLLIPNRVRWLRETLSVLGAAAFFVVALLFFKLGEINFSIPWTGLGIDFDLRLFQFSQFILLALAGFVFLIALFSTVKMAGNSRIREYYGYLFLTAAMAAGATLANNFVVLIFFWEGLLLTLYGLITIGGKNSHRTAVKSLIIGGFCDFCLILGIAILWSLTGTLRMSDVSIVPHGLGAVSFFLMMIGAIGKAGAMPFHTWIPDAAIDAPVTVMAYIPAALEKLLGIYLLTRIALDFFTLKPNDPFSLTLMIIGAATIVLAVAMALIQKDLKKLLSYHAVSQVGYMILGIGTAVPIGIAGGIFHMVNHAMYKCGLFLSAGSVEHRAGTTELKKLGGLWREMPVTALSFVVCAAAISGIWPLNGFVSKEMVFHGTAHHHITLFTVAAWVGAILTLASFLKAGHSTFFGPRSVEVGKVKESQSPIYLPMLILSALCVLFGVYNQLPLRLFIQPIIAGRFQGSEPIHLPMGAAALNLFSTIALISTACLLLALGLHLFGFFRNQKKAYLASEPIHRLPVIRTIYDWAEKQVFDIYEQGIKFIKALSAFLFKVVDRPIDFFFEKVVTGIGRSLVRLLQAAHNGYYANYLAWSLSGLVAIVWIISLLLK